MISPNKLAAFAQKVKGKKSLPFAHEEHGHMADEALEKAHMGENEEDFAAHEAAESEELESLEHSELMGMLREKAEDLDLAVGGIREELNHDDMPEEDAVEQIEDAISEIDGLKDALKKHLKGVAYKDVLALAQHLEAEDLVTDAEQVAGFLYWAAKNV